MNVTIITIHVVRYSADNGAYGTYKEQPGSPCCLLVAGFLLG
jgi:hypothetical protein